MLTTLAFRPAPVSDLPIAPFPALVTLLPPSVSAAPDNALSRAPPLSFGPSKPSLPRANRGRGNCNSMPFLSAANSLALGSRTSSNSVLSKQPDQPLRGAVAARKGSRASQQGSTRINKIHGHNLRNSVRRDNVVGRKLPIVTFSNLALRPASKAVGPRKMAPEDDGSLKKQQPQSQKGKQLRAKDHEQLIKNVTHGIQRATRTPTNQLLAMLTEHGQLSYDGQQVIEANLFDMELGYTSFGSGLDDLTHATSKQYNQWRRGIGAVPRDRMLRPALSVLLRAFFESYGNLYDRKRSMMAEEKERGEEAQKCYATITAMLDSFWKAARVDLVDALWEHFLEHRSK